jgi:tetrahydromethanopterin S-methyltransferase subunit B
MESVTKSNNNTVEDEPRKTIPGRIGVYERPQGISGSVLLFGLVGLVALLLVALLIFVMLM